MTTLLSGEAQREEAVVALIDAEVKVASLPSGKLARYQGPGTSGRPGVLTIDRSVPQWRYDGIRMQFLSALVGDQCRAPNVRVVSPRPNLTVLSGGLTEAPTLP